MRVKKSDISFIENLVVEVCLKGVIEMKMMLAKGKIENFSFFNFKGNQILETLKYILEITGGRNTEEEILLSEKLENLENCNKKILEKVENLTSLVNINENKISTPIKLKSEVFKTPETKLNSPADDKKSNFIPVIEMEKIVPELKFASNSSNTISIGLSKNKFFMLQNSNFYGIFDNETKNFKTKEISDCKN